MSSNEYDGGIDSKLVFFFGLVAVIVVIEIIIAGQALFYEVERLERTEKIAMQSDEYVELKKEQHRQIEARNWVNESAGLATIPIDDAMQRVVQADGAVETMLRGPDYGDDGGEGDTGGS